MSQYLALDGKIVTQVASNSGWGQFGEWVAHLGNAPDLQHLVEHGWDQDLDLVEKQLKDAINSDRPELETLRVAEMVLEIVTSRGPATVATVTDGMTNSDTENSEIAEAIVPDRRQEKPWTCGVAALRSVLAHFGIEVSEERLAAQLGANPSEGTSGASIERVVPSYGLRVNRKTGSSVEALASRGADPVIVPIQAYGGGHWCVVMAAGPDAVAIQDPVQGRVTMDKDEFERRWYDTDQDGNLLNRAAITIWK